MTVNKAYLVAPGATVTSNNMPVMTLGLYDISGHMTPSTKAIFAVFWPFHAQLLFFFDK